MFTDTYFKFFSFKTRFFFIRKKTFVIFFLIFVIFTDFYTSIKLKKIQEFQNSKGISYPYGYSLYTTQFYTVHLNNYNLSLIFSVTYSHDKIGYGYIINYKTT